MSLCPRAHVVQDKRAARMHVFVSRFAGTNAAHESNRSRFVRVACVPGRNVTFADPDQASHHRAFDAGAVLSVIKCFSLRFDPADGRAFASGPGIPSRMAVTSGCI